MASRAQSTYLPSQWMQSLWGVLSAAETEDGEGSCIDNTTFHHLPRPQESQIGTHPNPLGSNRVSLDQQLADFFGHRNNTTSKQSCPPEEIGQALSTDVESIDETSAAIAPEPYKATGIPQIEELTIHSRRASWSPGDEAAFTVGRRRLPREPIPSEAALGPAKISITSGIMKSIRSSQTRLTRRKKASERQPWTSEERHPLFSPGSLKTCEEWLPIINGIFRTGLTTIDRMPLRQLV